MAPDDDDRYPPLASDENDASTVHARVSGEEPAVSRFILTIVAGPERGNELELSASTPPVLVGTSPACDLRLTDRQVSRRHVALSVEDGLVVVTDLDSTNGTWLGHVRVERARVPPGEEIRVGATTLRLAARRGEGTALAPATSFGATLGQSSAMRRLYPLLERIAAADIPLVIEGETGTGKEVLAESIHAASPRAAKPFVVFDCTATPSSLLEGELFGHERGAFTGAVAARRGVFEQAHGGTLLIDEIGDLDLALQPKLLRAIQRGEIRRLGSERWTKVDVRIMAATRRDLEQAVTEGRFRDDLYHRLAVARVELPPLRVRREDVAFLARHFARELGGEPEAIVRTLLDRWSGHSWPGNVRELRNVVARHVALGDLAEATAPSTEGAEKDWLEEVLARELPLTLAREQVVAAFERRYLERALAASGGSVVNAARKAGVARRYFQVLKAKRFVP